LVTDKRDEEHREEIDATGEERAEAEALRRLLDGEEPGGDAPEDLEALAETAALLRAGGELGDDEAIDARLALVRQGLLSAPELAQRAEAPASFWKKLGQLGWRIWVPAGGLAVVLMLVVVPMAIGPIADDEAPAREMAEAAPGSPEPVVPPAAALESPSVWDGLPVPPRALLAAQARVASGEGAGLASLREPMAAYRARLYSVLAARYQHLTSLDVPQRMASR
jgi:hypothetical protein